MSRKRPLCFVVMPFGKKLVGRNEHDFDLVFKALIEPAGEAAGHRVRRADGAQGGLIVPAMLHDLYRADVVVADVTYHNPNVFYELGVRHALARHGTVLMRRGRGEMGLRRVGFGGSDKVQETPFDIKDVRIAQYDLSKKTLDDQIVAVKNWIEAAASRADTDSPVYFTVPSLRVSEGSSKARGRQDRTYEVVGAPGKFIGYRSGDIANLRDDQAFDFWVNSENTLMQMARFYERSFSSTIRFLGARNSDPNSAGFEDTIATALKNAMGDRAIVQQGEILVTTSGRLAETHGVHSILHAATVTGRPGDGFRPIADEALCETVIEAVTRVRDIVREQTHIQAPSILMPLFGTGQGRRDAGSIAGQLLSAAIDALSTTRADVGARDVRLVAFSAFTEEDVATMRRCCEALVRDGALRPSQHALR